MESAESFLFNWAGVFAFLAWALFLLVIVASCVIGTFIAIYKGYGMGGRRNIWPIHTTIVRLLLVATVLSFCVAIFASVTPNPALASIAVIGVWTVLASSSAISIARAPKGPQELFARTVGDENFTMPNRYRPPNEESGGGFGFMVCLDPFDEPDRQLCQKLAYVSVKPLAEGLNHFTDIKFWQDNRDKMKQLDPMFGHEQFVFTRPSDYDPGSTTAAPPCGASPLNTHRASNFYLVRYDGDRLARFVKCYNRSATSECRQYVFSEDRILMVSSSMWALEHWLDVEKNINALLKRWRTPTLD